MSKLTKNALQTEIEKANKTFGRYCGRLEKNLDADPETLNRWAELGIIELRKDQPLPYWEQRMF